MQWWEATIIALAGLWAGLINTVVGSGTLVTFPVLVALGYPPVTATTSNAIGLIGGSITGAVGYRSELAGHGHRVARYAVASVLGAVGATVLLLSLPADAFETIAPVLIGISVVLVLVQPVLSRRLGAPHPPGGEPSRRRPVHERRTLGGGRRLTAWSPDLPYRNRRTKCG